jgi:hypothetical protein
MREQAKEIQGCVALCIETISLAGAQYGYPVQLSRSTYLKREERCEHPEYVQRDRKAIA